MNKRRKWTEEEVSYVLENINKIKIEDIAKELNRPVGGVRWQCKLNKVKVKDTKKPKRWTTEENDFIQKNWGILTVEEIALRLNRSFYSVEKHCQTTCKNKNEYWTEEEDGFLKENQYKISYDGIGKLLGKSGRAVNGRVQLLKLSNQKPPNYTREEDFIIRKYYGKIPVSEIALKIERVKKAVISRASKIGVSGSYKKDLRMYFDRPLYPELAYILGFLFGDGNISIDRSRCSMALMTKDAYYIKPIMLKVAPWKFRYQRPVGLQRRPQLVFYLHNDYLINFLTSVWELHEKSYYMNNTFFNYIDDSNYKYLFMRGLLDADGHIKKGQGVSAKISARIDFDWTNIIKLLAPEIDYIIEKRVDNSGKCSILSFGKVKDVCNLLNFLYPQDDKCPKLALPRKKHRALRALLYYSGIKYHSVSRKLQYTHDFLNA